MKKQALTALIGVLTITGCASNDRPPTVITERTLIFEEDNRRYIHSIATTEYGNQGLGGAAVLQPDNIHVMADERRTADAITLQDQAKKAISEGTGISAKQKAQLKKTIEELEGSKDSEGKGEIADKIQNAMDTLASIQATDTKAHLSHYDLELWERFCSGGNEMTEDDWGQMLSSSVDQIPASVKADCKMPDLSLTDEITEKHCSDEPLTKRQRFILSEHKDELECPSPES